MKDEELAFLDRKTESALKHYTEGVPLKDVWNDEDTLRLMEAYRYIYWMLEDLNS